MRRIFKPSDSLLTGESIVLPWWGETAVRLKTKAFEIFDDERGCLPATVLIERGNTLYASVVSTSARPETALTAFEYLHRVHHHDALIFIIEVFTKWLTGDALARFKPGELAAAVEAGQQDAQGITEMLVALRADGDKIEQLRLPFHHDGPGSRLVWLKAQFTCEETNDATSGGYVLTALRTILAEPRVDIRAQVRARPLGRLLEAHVDSVFAHPALERVPFFLLAMEGFGVCMGDGEVVQP